MKGRNLRLETVSIKIKYSCQAKTLCCCLFLDVIKNHLASGVYQAADLTNGMKIQMVSGKSYTINLNPGRCYFDR